MSDARIVLTGGPCAGKTTMADIVARTLDGKAASVPESASMLFAGGFPRYAELEAQRATQDAIYHVQINLERAYAANFPGLAMVLDRGTIDGAAYWPEGPAAFFHAMGTTLERELARYTQVVYLQSASEEEYRLHRKKNPYRKETWEEATKLDRAAYELWSQHPRFTYVQQYHSFAYKTSLVLWAIDGAMEAEGPDGKK